MSSGARVRAIAARCVAEVMNGRTLESALEEHDEECPHRDIPLLREICFGTLRAFPRLQALLEALLRKPMRKQDRELQALALVGLYQISGMRTPDHAAVSATVDATSQLRRKSARGLINAVLRRYLRERIELEAALTPAAAAASPEWLWDALGECWPAQREAIAEASNSRPPLTLRVNRLWDRHSEVDRHSIEDHSSGDRHYIDRRNDYLKLLANEEIDARAGTLSADAITLTVGRDVSKIPSFEAGGVSVQDEAAQLAALLLAPQSGERILDACAAPGGKSCHILELAEDVELLACDVNDERLSRVEENAERLGLELEALCADLSDPPEVVRTRGPFDAILLDVPCSASGVIRRHPDIKLLRRETDVDGFVAQQRALLAGCWPLLKSGGRLLYVTCSILPAENSAVVGDFLKEHPEARERELKLAEAEKCAHGIQLLPAVDGTDGLYYALLEKSPARQPTSHSAR